MPVAEDWKTCPLGLVERTFKGRQDNDDCWSEQLSSQFNALLSDPANRNTLPSLNFTPNHELRDGQLVRFRGMVQDMYDPEIYMAEYETRNLSTGVKNIQCGRYRDVLPNSIREEVLEDSEHVVMKDRHVVYCVSIPGENPWVTELLAAQAENKAGPSGTYQNPLKRGLDPSTQEIINGESMEGMEMDGDESKPEDEPTSNGLVKKSKGENGNPVVPGVPGVKPTQGSVDLNLPIPNQKGKAAIVKLYDVPEGEIKLTDLLDIVGVISLDPAMALSEPNETSIFPPPSLVPRLHVVHFKKLAHNNPLVGEISLTRSEMESTRAKLLHILTESLLGDTLAAEYLLLHLISKVTGRRDIRVLGKMCLNLFRLDSTLNWSRRIYTLVGLFSPGSHHLPLSRNQLELTKFVPFKDFEANRLVSGVLQLPAGTNLVLDETAMTDGQLSAKGVQNLTALGNLITWQKVDYDFKYHSLDYDTDLPVLVLSDGRSLLPSDFQVMVKPEVENVASILENKFKNIGALLTQDLLNRIRVYLTLCREMEYILSDTLQKEVQDDFVRLRQEDERRMSVDDMHSHLVLARLVAVSKGKNELDGEDWSRVKEMESERRNTRIPPPRGEASLANGIPLHLAAS